MQHVIRSSIPGRPGVSVFLRDHGGNRPPSKRFEFTTDRTHVNRYPTRGAARDALQALRLDAVSKLRLDLQGFCKRAVVVPAKNEGLASDGSNRAQDAGRAVVAEADAVRAHLDSADWAGRIATLRARVVNGSDVQVSGLALAALDELCRLARNVQEGRS